MAVFNPAVQPVAAPDFTNVTKPITQPEADKSVGLTLDTVGKGIEGATQLADTAVKEDIKTTADTGVDKLRDAYTQNLVTLRNAQIGQSQTAESLLPDAGTPPPPGLDAGLDRVKQLGVAMAQNGGKINDTLYTGGLNALAKQLRTQYPGYRDYIDQQIKEVSGVDPANAFMKNLMEDINRNAENNKTQLNATLGTLRDNANSGFHDNSGVTASQVYTAVSKGALSPDAGLAWLNSAKKLEYDNKVKADNRSSRLGDDADAAVNASKGFDQTITQTINHNVQTMTIGKGTDTFDGLQRFLQSHAGKGDVNDETAQAMGQQMQTLRTRTAQQLLAQAASDGTLAHMGADGSIKLKAQIDARLAPMDLAIQDVFNKDWGSAYSHLNFNKAIGADTGNLLNNAPNDKVREYIRMSTALNQSSPEFAREYFKQNLLGDVPKNEKEWIKSTGMGLMMQPLQTQGKLTSIQGAITDAKAAGVSSPKSFTSLVKNVDFLSDPRLADEQKLNLAKAFFDPNANHGLLSDENFVKDHYDPTLKREVPGKYSVFTRLSNENTASSINKLGMKDPDVISNYQTMMSREFGEQLYSREIKDLAQTNARFTASNPNGSPTFQVKLTNEPKQPPRFTLIDNHGDEVDAPHAMASGLQSAYTAVNRLNGGMSGLWNVYNYTGADANQKVMENMYRYGYQDPSSPISGAVKSTLAHDALKKATDANRPQ